MGLHRVGDDRASNTSLRTLSKSVVLIKSKSGLEGRILTRPKTLVLFHFITLLGQFSMGYQICLLFNFWASLTAQLVKNLPAMQETWVQLLGWEDPLEKGKATHSSILA